MLKLGDNKSPYTENWSFIISQAVPWKSTLELQYQGNRTRNALLAGNGTNVPFYPNINKIPLGALYGPDPVTGANVWETSCADGRAGGLGGRADRWVLRDPKGRDDRTGDDDHHGGRVTRFRSGSATHPSARFGGCVAISSAPSGAR